MTPFTTHRHRLPVTVDLVESRFTWGNQTAALTIDPTAREQLLNGWDDVQVTQSFAAANAAFKTRDATTRPWMRPVRATIGPSLRDIAVGAT